MNVYDYKIEMEDYEFYIENYIQIIRHLYEVIKDKLIEEPSLILLNLGGPSLSRA